VVERYLLNMLHQGGTYLIGILMGELLLHRLPMCIQQLGQNKQRSKQKKKNKSKNKSLQEVTKSVFSSRHQQYFLFPLLVSLGFIFVKYSDKVSICYLDSVAELCPIIVVWGCLRRFGAFDQPVEDLEIIEDMNAELGPGLAANYWFSFLEPVMTLNIKHKIEKLLESLGLEDSWNYEVFPKLLNLLPDDCDLDLRNEEMLQDEHIYKCLPGVCDGSGECCHDLECSLEPGERRATIKQPVYWIYKDPAYEQDKEKQQDNSAAKIFFIFDFPQLIKNSMGPGKGWNDQPGAVTRNVNSFKRTLKSFLNGKDAISFIPFSNKEQTQIGEQRKTLSAVIREKVIQEEARIYSSSSASESEL